MAVKQRYVPPYPTVAVFAMQRTLLMDDMKAFKYYVRSLPSGPVPLETLRKLDVLIARFETLERLSKAPRLVQEWVKPK